MKNSILKTLLFALVLGLTTESHAQNKNTIAGAPLTTPPKIVTNKMELNISLYPNPNKGAFEFNCVVQSINDEYLYYGVFDIAGRLLVSGDGVSHSKFFHGRVDTGTPLVQGQYMLMVVATDTRSMVHFEVN